MRRRTRAREIALQFLYCQDGTHQEPRPDAAVFLADHSKDAEVRAFALALIDGVQEHAPAIETTIRDVAKNWDVSRMSAIDRNILRIGTFELLQRKDIPPQVTLNEAIELAKRYGAEKSGSFVNGLLDAIRFNLSRESFTTETRGLGRGAAIADPDGETDEATDEGGEFPPLPGL